MMLKRQTHREVGTQSHGSVASAQIARLPRDNNFLWQCLLKKWRNAKKNILTKYFLIFKVNHQIPTSQRKGFFTHEE